MLNRVKLRSRVDAFHLSFTAGHKELVLEPPAECHPISPVGVPWCLGEGLQLRKGFCQPFLRGGSRVCPGPGTRFSLQVMYVTSPADRALLGVCFGDGHFADGQWVSVSDNEDAVCCVPSAVTLYRTWKRAVGFLRRCGVLVPGEVCLDIASARALGAKFPCSGVSWRVPVAGRVRCELCFQFSVCSSLSSVRLPPFW